jgi:hypothetical protein
MRVKVWNEKFPNDLSDKGEKGDRFTQSNFK